MKNLKMHRTSYSPRSECVWKEKRCGVRTESVSLFASLRDQTVAAEVQSRVRFAAQKRRALD